MIKIPTVNLQYWALMIITTMIGETGGDLISKSLHIGYSLSAAVLALLFVVFLLLSLRSKLFDESVYWTLMIIASTCGTTISDYMSRTLELGYGKTCLFLAVVLLVLLTVFNYLSKLVLSGKRREKQLEFVYWQAILLSGTLGTAFGDLISNGTQLGFDGGTIVLVICLVLFVLASYFISIPRNMGYWIPLIIIHPLGATAGDLVTKPEGAALDNTVATVLLVVIFASVIYFGAYTQKNEYWEDH